MTELPSILNYRNFVLGSQRILLCFFAEDIIVFRKVDLKKRMFNSFHIYIFFFCNYLFLLIYMMLPVIIIVRLNTGKL